MTPRFALRLCLDLIAAGLLVAGLAYWWLGNSAHELIGTALFLLVLAHNGLNRRWYGRLDRHRRRPRGRALIALNLALLAAFATLIASGVVLSRMVFAALPFEAGILSRELHLLSAHWVMVLVGLHIGLNWRIVMAQLRRLVPEPLAGRPGQAIAGIGVVAIVLAGLHNVTVMELLPKLINQPTFDMWDFNRRTPEFFARWLSIIGLCAVLGHQGARLLPERAQGRTLG